MKTRTRRYMRLAAGIAALATLFAPLAACGSSSGSANTSKISKNGVDDGTTISLWTRAPLESQAKHAANAYNSTHKNKVKLTIIPNDDMEGKVGSATQTGSLPDVLAGDVVRVPYWTREGVFADLNKQINSLPELDDLQKGHIEAGTVDGKKHTVPFVTDISVMVWNKDLFKKAGLNPDKGPKSIAEFVKDAQAVAKLNENGVAGSYLPGQSGGALTFNLFPSIWADGETALSKDGKKATLTNPSAKEVFAAYRTLAHTKNGLGAGSKEETGATWTAPFQNGKIGVMPYPATSLMQIIDKEKSGGFKVGVEAIPGTKEGTGATYLGGDAMGISKNCKHVNQAWNFISWLMTDKAQTEVFAKYGDTASNTKTLATAYNSSDPRVKIINSTVGMKESQTPIGENFSQAFNAAGSPYQLLIQDQVWGNASKLAADNEAVTKVLAQ